MFSSNFQALLATIANENDRTRIFFKINNPTKTPNSVENIPSFIILFASLSLMMMIGYLMINIQKGFIVIFFPHSNALSVYFYIETLSPATT
jgi:hypothetical protein